MTGADWADFAIVLGLGGLAVVGMMSGLVALIERLARK